jgi:hypothetical protein
MLVRGVWRESIMLQIRNWKCTTVLFAVLSSSLASETGCEQPSDVADAQAQDGVLALRTVAIAESVTYRLVGATFQVNGPESAVLSSDTLPDSTELSALLQPGAYSVALQPGWSIERVNPDSSVTPVAADLGSAAIQDVTIVSGSTSRLTYRFLVGGIVVEFSYGELDIQVQANEFTEVHGTRFVWTSSGNTPEGYTCTLVYEPSDPVWSDNYLCASNDIGLVFGYGGPYPGWRCTSINEPSDPDAWSDNYLCVPPDSPYYLQWSYGGPIGAAPINISDPEDPHPWFDNYLNIFHYSPSELLPPQCAYWGDAPGRQDSGFAGHTSVYQNATYGTDLFRWDGILKGEVPIGTGSVTDEDGNVFTIGAEVSHPFGDVWLFEICVNM